MVKSPPANAGDVGSVPGSGSSSGEGTYSSILAWEIPGIEDPGGLQPMGSQSRSQLSMYAHTILNM